MNPSPTTGPNTIPTTGPNTDPTTDDEALPNETQVRRAALDDAAFDALVARLNRQSVDKHFDAYGDVDWDHPDNVISPTDPRFIEACEGTFGKTDWYGTLDQDTRARIGLHLIADRMRTGMLFENILSRGLLNYAANLPSGSNEYRYVLHEVVEESQHSMMFQEFVNRTGLDMPRIPLRMRLGGPRLVALAHRFPELFFVFVLGGEDPIDHVQREALRNDLDLHPLTRRIMRIHVTEEARHLSFARHQLKRRVAQLSRPKRFVLAHAAPFILFQMSGQMLGVPGHIAREYNIPAEVLAAVKNDPENREFLHASLSKVRRLLDECGLLTRSSLRLWSAFGLQ